MNYLSPYLDGPPGSKLKLATVTQLGLGMAGDWHKLMPHSCRPAVPNGASHQPTNTMGARQISRAACCCAVSIWEFNVGAIIAILGIMAVVSSNEEYLKLVSSSVQHLTLL